MERSDDVRARQTGRLPARWMAIGLALTLTVIVAGSWTAFRSYQETRALAGREARLGELSGTIVHLDEVLTMSARMAAATGDLRWEQRYRSFEPQLATAIDQMLVVSPDTAVRALSAQTAAANEALVALENRAFTRVRAGDRRGASALLFGADYERHKQLYARGMIAAMSASKRVLGDAIAGYGTRVVIEVTVAAVLLLVLAIAWARAVVLVRKRSQRLSVALASLERNHQQLGDAHRELEALHRELVAKEKLSSLGMLAAGLAHEINNPMAYVTANISSLLSELEELGRERLPVMLGEYIEDILPATLDGIDRVNTIVRDLQRFSRGDIDGMTEYDLGKEIAAAVRISNSQVRGRCKLTVELGELPVMRGKPQQVTQVLVNLIVNAVHAIDDRQQGLITVSAARDGERVILSVRDNGCGMAPDVVERAFQPFFTTKPVGQGTGLGLSVVHGIVQAHGGTLRIESEVGHGSCFTISLPIDPPSPPLTEKLPALVTSGSALVAMGSSIHPPPSAVPSAAPIVRALADGSRAQRTTAAPSVEVLPRGHRPTPEPRRRSPR